MAEEYKKVLQYLETFSGDKYRKLEKCKNNSERQRMILGAEAGREAWKLVKQLADKIAKVVGMDVKVVTQWQNSGSFVSYFWAQIKKPEHENSGISLSLFAEKKDNDYRYRLSVELNESKSSDEDVSRYKRLLEMELEDGLVYVAGGNNDSTFEVLSGKQDVGAGKYNKIQVSYIAPNGISDSELERVLFEKAQVLVKYYDYVFEKTDVPKESKNSKDTVVSRPAKDVLKDIKEYIKKEGLEYDDEAIDNYYLCLKTKPFVILAGTSGTGKTKLVKLFADAIEAEYRIVSVRPDWSDSTDLLGHVNLNGEVVGDAVTGFIEKAKEEIDKPFFLCLDEMNLARVEYYMSDFLSVIETRERKGNRIETAPFDIDTRIEKKYASKINDGKVRIPDNLYVVGTVNMDETTFPFSKKVLDRANTIEFSKVNFDFKLDNNYDVNSQSVQNNSFLKTQYLSLKKDIEPEQEAFVKEICDKLSEINDILQVANLQVAYRIRDEIVFYMLNNASADLLAPNVAFDFEIMQKILPRIQGSSTAVKNVLEKLLEICKKPVLKAGKATDDDESGTLADALKEKQYPKSAEKIAYMIERYKEDGFTSYWV